MSLTTTLAPRAAKSSAITRPQACPAPVTSTTLPVKSSTRSPGSPRRPEHSGARPSGPVDHLLARPDADVPAALDEHRDRTVAIERDEPAVTIGLDPGRVE